MLARFFPVLFCNLFPPFVHSIIIPLQETSSKRYVAEHIVRTPTRNKAWLHRCNILPGYSSYKVTMKNSGPNETGGGELGILLLFGLALYTGIFLLLAFPREPRADAKTQHQTQPTSLVEQVYAFTRLVAYLGGGGQ